MSIDAIDIKVEDFSYTWAIKKYGHSYRNLNEKYKSISSPLVEFDTDPNTQWVLRLSIRQDNDLMEAVLKRGTISDNVKVELSLQNTDKENSVIMVKELDNKGYIFSEKCMLSLSVPFKEVSNILQDGTLLVRLKITYSFLVPKSECFLYRNKKQLPKLSGFEKLFANEKYSDAQIIVDGHVFNVHKCILDARSEYFSAMFNSDMKEKKDNKVEITDVSHEVMQEVLRFIYTGEVNNVDAFTMDLYVAADKCMIEDLKILCEDALYQDLKVENSLKTLIFAERYKLNDLEKAALEFFKIHRKEILALDYSNKTMKDLPESILFNLIEL